MSNPTTMTEALQAQYPRLKNPATLARLMAAWDAAKDPDADERALDPFEDVQQIGLALALMAMTAREATKIALERMAKGDA